MVTLRQKITPYEKNAWKTNKMGEIKKAVKTANKQPKKAPGVPFVKNDPRINREGRPEGSFSLLSLLKAELQKCPDGQDKKTYADLIVKRMLKESIEKGDQTQIKLIWNYIEGMPKQALEIDNPAQVEAIKSLEEIIKTIRK